MNIVLLIADTLRLKDIAADNMELFEDRENIFYSEKYVSNASWTVPAHATIFTGDLPSEHGTYSQNPYFERRNNLIDAMRGLGFETIGLSENPLFSDVTNLSKGFETFINVNEDLWEGKTWKDLMESDYDRSDYLYFLMESLLKRDYKSIKSFVRYLNKKIGNREDFNPTYTNYTIEEYEKAIQGEEDKFIALNLMPTHLPYTLTEEERGELEGMTDEKIERLSKYGASDIYDVEFTQKELEERKEIYKASIRYLERRIEELIDKSPENTKFVIVGDHGELLGERRKNERRLLGHHFGTFKELVRVPFWICPEPENLEFEGLLDHSILKDILVHLATEEEKAIGKNQVRSEYFGKSGFDKNFGDAEGFTELDDRKSFSILNEALKYDLASDGEYLWEFGPQTEERAIGADKLSFDMRNKAEIHYEWRFRDENN